MNQTWVFGETDLRRESQTVGLSGVSVEVLPVGLESAGGGRQSDSWALDTGSEDAGGARESVEVAVEGPQG